MFWHLAAFDEPHRVLPYVAQCFIASNHFTGAQLTGYALQKRRGVDQAGAELLREATFARGLVVAGAGAASFVVARALLGVGIPTGRGETRVDVLGATDAPMEAIHASVTALDIPVVAVAGGRSIACLISNLATDYALY